MAVITPEEYYTFIGSTKPVTAQDTALCEAVSLVIENFIGRELEYKERVEYYSSNNDPYVVLKVRPVYEVSEVRLDDKGFYNTDSVFDDDDTILNPSEYALKVEVEGQPSKCGLLIRTVGIWNKLLEREYHPNIRTEFTEKQTGNIKITYTAGYDPIPADIKLAAVQIISRLKNGYLKFGAGVIEEELGDWYYKLGTLDLKNPELGSVRQILARYREVF